jgi:hypothetical protein
VLAWRSSIENLGEKVSAWPLGPTRYNEKNVYINARRTGALAYLFPEKQFPDGITSLNLRAFASSQRRLPFIDFGYRVVD